MLDEDADASSGSQPRYFPWEWVEQTPGDQLFVEGDELRPTLSQAYRERVLITAWPRQDSAALPVGNRLQVWVGPDNTPLHRGRGWGLVVEWIQKKTIKCREQAMGILIRATPDQHTNASDPRSLRQSHFHVEGRGVHFAQSQ